MDEILSYIVKQTAKGHLNVIHANEWNTMFLSWLEEIK